MLKHLIWDYGTPVARITDNNETAAILREIEHEFTKDGAIQYSHKVGVRLRYRHFMWHVVYNCTFSRQGVGFMPEL